MEPFDILLVEDNADHAELTRRALEGGSVANKVHWVKDGAQALEYLFREGEHANSRRPGLVLLDIKLPKVSGVEVLQRIKGEEDLKMIPVIMLTTSDREDEVYQCYKAGANSFITKPVKFADFSEKIRSLKVYWVLTNRVPDFD